MTTTFERLKAIIVADNFFSVRPEEIRPEATLEALSFDSLDVVNLVISIEEEWRITIGDEAAFAWKSMADVVAAIDGAPRCRVCGCTELAACHPPCWWVEPDLCSACVGRANASAAPDPDAPADLAGAAVVA